MLYIAIADMTIKINNQHNYLPWLCAKYTVPQTDDISFSVEVTQEEIDAEQADATGPFNQGYLESLAVYRKIAAKISGMEGCLMHGVLMEMDGRGILLCAPSGVGKSTHAKLWQECFGKDRCHIVNGDKPLVLFRHGKLYGYGTPWCGKEGWSENRKVEITDICFISRAPQNSIIPLPAEQALGKLLTQLYFPEDDTLKLSVLDRADLILSQTKTHQILCNIEKEAALLAQEGIWRS